MGAFNFSILSLSDLHRCSTGPKPKVEYSTFWFLSGRPYQQYFIRNLARPPDKEDPASASFALAWFATLEDSIVCLGQAAATMPTSDDDEVLVRMSMKLLDIGEEPVLIFHPGGGKCLLSLSRHGTAFLATARHEEDFYSLIE